MRLELAAVDKSFGGLRAVRDVSFSVESGSIHALIGPNGAGKTTILNLITRVVRPDRGRILLGGRDLAGTRPDQVVGLGLARTFQHVELFGGLDVIDNVVAGSISLSRSGFVQDLLRLPGARRDQEEARTRARATLTRVGLQRLERSAVGELTAGQARLVGLARALASGPRLLLLDEVVAGLNTRETADAIGVVRALRDELGITILLIEHDMRFVMALADRVTVVDFGETIADGTPAQIRADPRVIEAYLGGSDDD